MNLEFAENLGRLGVATLIGAVVGVNRDLHHKPAGLRVLSLVSLGAAAIMLVSSETTSIDGISRTLQGILTGIGFLGGGVILRGREGEEVHGLTTSAAIWMVAVLGAICGLGRWITVAMVFSITMLILTVGRSAELWIQEHRARSTPKPPPNGDTESAPPTR